MREQRILDPEKANEYQESLLDCIPDFITHSMENDHPDAAEEPHWTEYAGPHANPSVAFCKFFARDRCRNGALCTYRHASTSVQPLLESRLQQPPSSFGACAFYPLGKCRNGAKCI